MLFDGSDVQIDVINMFRCSANKFLIECCLRMWRTFNFLKYVYHLIATTILFRWGIFIFFIYSFFNIFFNIETRI